MAVTSEATTRFREAYAQALRELDSLRIRQWEQSRVTLPQLRVLYHVRRTPGVTTGELARALGITVSTVSGLVIKLVDRGLVERTTDPEDRRQAPLRLTAQGQVLAGELADASRAFLGRVAEHLGSDLGVVTAALERLAEAIVDARGTVHAAEDGSGEPREEARARDR